MLEAGACCHVRLQSRRPHPPPNPCSNPPPQPETNPDPTPPLSANDGKVCKYKADRGLKPRHLADEFDCGWDAFVKLNPKVG